MSNPSRLLCSVVVAAGFLGGPGLLAADNAVNSSNVDKGQARPPGALSKKLDGPCGCAVETARLEKRIEALERRIGLLEAGLKPARRRSAFKVPAAFADGQRMEEYRKRREERFWRYETTMRQESRDAQWADTFESVMTDIIKRAKLKGTHLDYVSCKKTICKMKLTHDNRDAHSRFFEYYEPASADKRLAYRSEEYREKPLDEGRIESVFFITR